MLEVDGDRTVFEVDVVQDIDQGFFGDFPLLPLLSDVKMVNLADTVRRFSVGVAH